MSPGFLSWPRIFLSLMEAYSSSTRRPGVGMSGTPPVSFSLSVLHPGCRHAQKDLISSQVKVLNGIPSDLGKFEKTEIQHATAAKGLQGG